MLVTPLFLCIGFMMAVLYIDLMFDVSAVPHRHAKAPLPKEVLDPIIHYYGRITQNPYVLMFVMLTTVTCIGAQIVYDQAPRWAAYSSLVLMALIMLTGTLKVIPTAQRLGAGKDPEDAQTRMILGMLPFHLVLLISVLVLAMIQFRAAGS